VPDLDKHLAASRHNNSFSRENVFMTGQYEDWKIIVLFYEAVHIIESYLATLGEDSGDHKERRDNIMHYDNLRTIAAEYDDLYKLSRTARYDCEPIYKVKVNAALEDLKVIRSHVQSILSA
jgi:hypothetical protein